MGACTRKRGSVCMSESGTCIASTSFSLTLRAHYVHHSSSIPFNLVFTCAGGTQESPEPPGDTTETTLTFQRNNHDEHNAYVCHDTGIPERRIFRLLFLLFVFLRFVPMFYKNFDATMPFLPVKARRTPLYSSAL